MTLLELAEAMLALEAKGMLLDLNENDPLVGHKVMQRIHDMKKASELHKDIKK